MRPWMRWLREVGRFVSFLLFQVLFLFWCVKVGYAFYGYFSNGGQGVRQALLRHMSNPYDSREWVPHPRWDIIALRYLAIALLTILFGIWSKRILKKLWADIRPRSVAQPGDRHPNAPTTPTTH